jgi:hypothetical protein
MAATSSESVVVLTWDELQGPPTPELHEKIAKVRASK